jgi:hypothetical protein
MDSFGGKVMNRLVIANSELNVWNLEELCDLGFCCTTSHVRVLSNFVPFVVTYSDDTRDAGRDLPIGNLPRHELFERASVKVFSWCCCVLFPVIRKVSLTTHLVVSHL